MVWLRSAALRMYAAIWVSNATGNGVAASSSARVATSTGLTSCPTSGVARRSSRRRRASDASGPSAATARPSPPTTASASGVPRRGRGSSLTSDTPTAAWSRSHGSSSSIRSAPCTSIRPGSTIAAASAAGRSSAGSNGRSADRRCGPIGRRLPDGIEVQPQLELRAGLAAGAASGSPALGSPGDAGRGDVTALGDGSERLDPLLGRLARHRRQPLDQRPELVFAEQPDDGVAVVVGQPRRLEVDLDRQVAHDRRQLAPHEDLLAMVGQLVAQLLGRDLIDAREQRVEIAELADELGRGLLADTGYPRDVVGRDRP